MKIEGLTFLDQRLARQAHEIISFAFGDFPSNWRIGSRSHLPRTEVVALFANGQHIGAIDCVPLGGGEELLASVKEDYVAAVERHHSLFAGQSLSVNAQGICVPLRRLILLCSYQLAGDQLRIVLVHELAHVVTLGDFHGPRWQARMRSVAANWPRLSDALLEHVGAVLKADHPPATHAYEGTAGLAAAAEGPRILVEGGATLERWLTSRRRGTRPRADAV